MRLINADTLKEECIDVLVGGGNYESAVLLEDITNAPTIEAEPVKHGEWETRKGIEYCSECNKSMMWQSNFCPNCGAKMDGGDDVY